MVTSRRSFLPLLAAIAAGAVIDPERPLWMPGKKLISIPKPKPITFRLNGADYLKAGDRFTMPVAYGGKRRAFVRREFVITAVCESSGVMTLEPAVKPAELLVVS